MVSTLAAGSKAPEFCLLDKDEKKVWVLWGQIFTCDMERGNQDIRLSRSDNQDT